MSWESGEGDKQAEVCLPWITRHRGVRDRLSLRLIWGFFFFLIFPEKGQNGVQVLDHGCSCKKSMQHPPQQTGTQALWHPEKIIGCGG